MNIVGIIPARYASGRLPGKPLADIGGKPMVWWVHRQAAQVQQLRRVVVATDDDRVMDACRALSLPAVMTPADCPTHLDRLWHASQQVKADFYIGVNGDEPLMEPDCIRALLPPPDADPAGFYAANAMAPLTDPAALVDTSNGKVVTDTAGYALYIARSPIPYPQGRGAAVYRKFVGVQCFSKPALDFAARTPRGPLEAAEDCDEFRFIENGGKLKFILTRSESFSVDTLRDLARVRAILAPGHE